ncbi:MAG: imidazole glycerol phosphate synthase subunit HisH [Candidatus Acidiferrum sp.]
MIATLIDYGAGNVTSVARALRRLGAEVSCTNRPEEIATAKCLVLPGVGHCGALISSLDAHLLRQPLLDAIAQGIPFLGICLGLQALYENSEEAPALPGLGLLEGHVAQLPQNVKLPHMGWNQLRALRSSRLLEGISPDAYFYFAHSYAAPANSAEAAALCTHGCEFTAVLERKSIFGVQFHPEKSGAPGAALLENFLRIAA